MSREHPGRTWQDINGSLRTHSHSTTPIITATILCPTRLDSKSRSAGQCIHIGGRQCSAALGDGGDLRGIIGNGVSDGKDTRGTAG